MRNYRASSGSQIRVDYGAALVRGLWHFEDTRPHSATFKALNDELDAQFKARIALRKPWIEARQDVRFCDYDAEQVIRTLQRVLEIADGSRRGPLSKDIFPDGITPVIAPAGAAQLPALVGLIDRFTKSRVAGIDAVRTAELPKLDAARTRLDTAAQAYKAARDAYLDAFGTEKAIRDEHRLAVTSLMGTVRALHPGDKQRQDVIFPESTTGSPAGAADDDTDDADTDPVAPADA